MKQSKNKGLTLKHKLKLSLSNFMERKWRNLLIATATSIGFIGVLISFGLGNAIVGMINDSTDDGNIPSQIQISLSAKSAGRGVLNADDEKFIRSQIKSDDIKYLESPFGMNMTSLTLDGKTVDFSKDLPILRLSVSTRTQKYLHLAMVRIRFQLGNLLNLQMKRA